MRTFKQKVIALSCLLLVTGIDTYAGIVTSTGSYVVVNTGATLVTDGVVNAGTLTNNGTIDNNGNWNNTGTVAVGSLVKLTGTGAQTLSGTTTFETLHLDNGSGASLTGGAVVNINTLFELKNGTFTTTGGTLRFLSTSVTHAAVLDNFSTGFGGSVSGNVTSQRFYNAASGTYNQHFMSSPVNAGAFSSFASLSGTDGTFVTPTSDCDETQLDQTSNYGNIFEWDESNVPLAGGCVLAGWKVRSSGSMTNAKGYSVMLTGSGTINVTNPANQTNNYTQSGLTNSNWSSTTLQVHGFNSGWHLIGNPYQSSLDLDATANSNFDNNVVVLNTHGSFAGTYQPLAMAGSGVLPPFQAFMAHKSTTGGSATFSMGLTGGSEDRTVTGATFHKTDEYGMTVQVEGNGFADITYVDFDANATAEYDAQFDGYKFPSNLGQPTLYTLIDEQWTSVNIHPDVASTPFIPMGFEPGTNGTYEFSADVAGLPQGTTVTLEDIRENVFQNLNNNPHYSFTSSVTDNRDRFILHFNGITTVMEEEVNTHAKVWSNANRIMIDASALKENTVASIYNAAGQLITESNITAGQVLSLNMDNSATGIYVVRVAGLSELSSHKVVIVK